MEKTDFVTIAKLYGYEDEPTSLCESMLRTAEECEATGFSLAECQMLDSTKLGQRQLIAYGPSCTHKAPPTIPFSPSGLASDMSTVTHFIEMGSIHEWAKDNLPGYDENWAQTASETGPDGKATEATPEMKPKSGQD